MINALTPRWSDTEKLSGEMHEWLKSNCAGHWTAEYATTGDIGVRGDLAVDLLFEQYEMRRTMNRLHKKYFIVRRPEDVGTDMVLQIPRTGSAERQVQILEHIRTKYSDAEIWNGTEWTKVSE